ncbi:MAG: hypothetical protein IJ859_07995 [Synergistaceae bacterium]|nr:hypothetical protein [Synergistaceae bacterium]
MKNFRILKKITGESFAAAMSRNLSRTWGGGTKFDLLVLDTAHIHPWETLNFLCVLPFMNQDSWVVLHDISLPLLSLRENDLACRYLFSNVVSDEKLMPVSDYDSYFANIGAFKITDDTRKYIGNLFQSLVVAWDAVPFFYDKYIFPCATPMLEEDLNDIRKIIKKYYPEHYEFFENAVKLQNVIIQHKTEVYKNWRSVLKRNFPYIVSPIRMFRALRKKLMRR